MGHPWHARGRGIIDPHHGCFYRPPRRASDFRGGIYSRGHNGDRRPNLHLQRAADSDSGRRRSITITGAPGLAKTLLVKSIAQIFHLKFQRIQFTPDLMPADITGTEILQETGEGRRMSFVPGPVFANMILADEINRTPPKTQAALLEAMQEHQVTAAGVRHSLPEPFFVLATQNPIEMEGTYPLPEAQLDRFMFNVVIDYLPEDQEVEVVTQTTAHRPAGTPRLAAACRNRSGAGLPLSTSVALKKRVLSRRNWT